MSGPARRGPTGVTKRFRLYSERNHSLKAALLRGGRAQVRGVLGAATTSSFEIPAGPHVRPRRRERLGQVDAAQVHRPDPAARRRRGSRRTASSPRCSSSAAASTPSCPAARTSTSTARSWACPKASSTHVRRDRRLRRHRAVHRPAGEELLLRHVRPARLLHRHQRRPRHPARRRGARRRRRRLPAQVHGEVRRLPRVRQDRRRRQPRHGLDAAALRPGRLARARQARQGRPAATRSSTSTSTRATRTASRPRTAGTALGLRRGPHRAGRAARRPDGGPTTPRAHRSTDHGPAAPRARADRAAGVRPRARDARGLLPVGPNTSRDGGRCPSVDRGQRVTSTSSSTGSCCSPAPTTCSASLNDLRLPARLRLPRDARLRFDVETGTAARVRRPGRRSAAPGGWTPARTSSRPPLPPLDRTQRPPPTRGARLIREGTTCPSAGRQPRTGDPARCRVVVVNYKGADDTITCLQGLAALDWPADRLEVVVVDNARGDGSVERIRAAVPTPWSSSRRSNTGFAGGCNLGVAHSTGEYVGFLNNDARPDPRWVRAAVEVLERDRTDRRGRQQGPRLGRHARSTTSTARSPGSAWATSARSSGPTPTEYDVAEGRAVRHRRGDVRPHGRCSARSAASTSASSCSTRTSTSAGGSTCSATGSATCPTRSPSTSTTQSMKKFGEWREHYLLERNALMTMYKNYEDETARHALPGGHGAGRAPRHRPRRAIDAGAARPAARRRRRARRRASPSPRTRSHRPTAIDSFVEHLPDARPDRARAAGTPAGATDKDLVPAVPPGDRAGVPVPDATSRRTRRCVEAFGIEEHFSTRRRDRSSSPASRSRPRWPGPAIRAWEIASALSAEHDVVLGHPDAHLPSSATRASRTASVSGRDLRKLEHWCDVFIFQGLLDGG